MDPDIRSDLSLAEGHSCSGAPEPPEIPRPDSGAVECGPGGGSTPLIQRRVDPLDSRLDLAPVASASGAFEYLAHVDQGA